MEISSAGGKLKIINLVIILTNHNLKTSQGVSDNNDNNLFN
jgi:hypothetical protein